MSERQFYVYIMASRPWGTLYIGVTNDLAALWYPNEMTAAKIDAWLTKIADMFQ